MLFADDNQTMVYKCVLAASLGVLLGCPSVSSDVLYDESVDGALSTDRFAPTDMGALSGGSNNVLATTSSGISEFYSLTVPVNARLDALIVEDYQGLDPVAFIGVVTGTPFTVDPASPDVAALLGYTHYGAADIGLDILQVIGAGAGSQGFNGALGPGTYSFWVRQGSANPSTWDLNYVLLLAGLDFVADVTSLRASNTTTIVELQGLSVDRHTSIVGREVRTRLRDYYRDHRVDELGAGNTLRSQMSAGDGDELPFSIWANVSGAKFNDNFVSTSFDADVSSLLIGVDTFFGDQLLVGGLVGYERHDVETGFNSGSQDIDNYHLGAYAGYLIGDSFSTDVLLGYTSLDIEQTRIQPFLGQVSSDVDGNRWYVAGNLNFYHTMGSVLVDVTTGMLFAHDKQDSFTESNGLSNPSQTAKLGRWRFGGNVAYLHRDLELFGNAYLVYDFGRTNVDVGAPQLNPSDDRTEFQLGTGIRYVGQEDITASLEYNTTVGRDDVESNSLSLSVRMEF